MKAPIKMSGGNVQNGLSSKSDISAAVADEPKGQDMPNKLSTKATTVKKGGKSFELF